MLVKSRLALWGGGVVLSIDFRLRRVERDFKVFMKPRRVKRELPVMIRLQGARFGDELQVPMVSIPRFRSLQGTRLSILGWDVPG